MTLRDLFEGLPEAGSADIPDVEIGDLAYSSKSVKEGSVFFCVPGFKVDGHQFAAEAEERGARALVCERPLEVDLPQLIVPDVRSVMGPVATRFFGDPSARLQVIGVTGTNGKTTTTFLIRALMEAAGRRCGLLGTVHSIVAGRREPVERTTPEAPDLQRTLRRMVDGGDQVSVMEVSSHATELGRTNAIRFTLAVFTNVTQDHLDFHSTLEDYFRAKLRLFFPTAGPPPDISVVNADDQHGRRLIRKLRDTGRTLATYGMENPADYRADDIELGTSGAGFTVRAPEGEEFRVDTPLVGDFNVANALAAVAAGRSLGVDVEVVRSALASVGQVPGRFERVDEGQAFAVVVDYAHTPDSLANALRAVRGITSPTARLCVVFGCGGDRDRGKRPMMGEIATQLADRVVVTSDNPRNEDPQAIIDEIRAGAVSGGAELCVEPDRRVAIELALRRAEPGDSVLIAGKGHEPGQEFEGGRKVPFDDREVVINALRKLATSSKAKSQ